MNQEYKVSDPPKGRLRIAVMGLLLLAVIVASLALYFFTKVNQAASKESSTREVVIEKGTSANQVAQLLADEKIINNQLVFSFYVFSKGAQTKIQAGQYLLDRRMSIAEIVEIITRGRVISDERRVTVIEGWSNGQIAEHLIDRGIVTDQKSWNEILHSSGWDNLKINQPAAKVGYQGFLFPDTYSLGRQETAGDLIFKMLQNFERQLTPEVIDDLQSQGPDRLKEIITLASIIEKEVGRNKQTITEADRLLMQQERELVASVFYNRLKINMPLQSDATVNFITGKKDRQVTFDDAKIKSPYNTYVVTGLPPTPIGNPGLDSINAAINPAQSDYLYFLNSVDGTAHFAKDLAGHNANRAQYLD